MEVQNFFLMISPNFPTYSYYHGERDYRFVTRIFHVFHNNTAQGYKAPSVCESSVLLCDTAFGMVFAS